jgi:hypothetical protein
MHEEYAYCNVKVIKDDTSIRIFPIRGKKHLFDGQ